MSNGMPSLPDALAHDWWQLTALIEEVGERQPIPCRRSEIVHPEAWTSLNDEDQADAARECRKCPALDPCRRYGLDHPKEMGVYGGLTQDERRTTSRNRKEAP